LEVSNFRKHVIKFFLHYENTSEFWVNLFSDLYNFVDDVLWP
jgi:hypothetical protein